MHSTMTEHLQELARVNLVNSDNMLENVDLSIVRFNQDTDLGLILEAYREIFVSGGLKDSEILGLLSALYLKQSEGQTLREDDEETFVDSSGTGGDNFDSSNPKDPKGGGTPEEETPEENTPDDGQSTFAEEYPEADEASILEKVYLDWLASVKGKPFFKTLKTYSEQDSKGLINPSDRIFLFRLIKSISSAITHLIIEAEMQPESICLMDKYYDSLVRCLDSVVHASDTEDVLTAFRYMVGFLGLVESQGDKVSTTGSDEDY